MGAPPPVLKAFLKDTAIYGAANMFMRAIQLLLVPLYTRVLAPADYGSVDVMMVTAAVAMSVLTLEIAQGMVRSYGDAATPDAKVAYASTALWITVGSAAVCVVVAAFGGPLAAWVLRPGLEDPFRVAVLAIAAQLLFNVVTAQLRFDLRPVTYGVVTVLFTLVSNAVAVILVVRCDTGVIGVFWGQLAGYVVAGAVGALASRRAFALRFDRARAREMLAFSAPLVLSVIGAHVAMLTDRIAIKGFIGLEEVGVYGIGARVASTVGLLLTAFGAALAPLIYKSYAAPETPAQLARLYRVFLLLILPVLVGLAMFAHEIVRVLAPPAYARAADVIPLLSLAVTFSGMSIFTPGMELSRRTRVLAILMVVIAFENVGLNVLLIPPLGVNGSALATLISAATGFAGYVVFSQRFYPVPHRWSAIAVAVAIAGAASAAGIALTHAGLGLAPTIAIKAVVWLVASLALVPVLLERADLAMVRDRIRGSRTR